MKTRILFVCLGNICRSPAAEGIMRRIVERRGLSGTFGIDSAGTYGGHESLNRLAPSREAARKIFRMAEFCRRHPDRTYVPDPYYEGHEGFELVLDMLEDGCEGILEYLSENGK